MPDTFILMGGDACHFSGAMRPNPGYPMPDTIPEGILDSDAAFPGPCPASFFLDDHPQCSARHESHSNPSNSIPSETPFYALSTDPHTVYDTPDVQTAQATVSILIKNFDSAPNVLVALAHDTALLDHLPTLNSEPEKDLNDWFANGWKEKCYWGWLNEVARRGQPGRKKIVDGWWMGDRQFGSARELLDAVEKEGSDGRGSGPGKGAEGGKL